MLDIQSVIDQMLVLLILMIVGYACGKIGVVDSDGTKHLSNLTLNVCQGCMTVASVMNLDADVAASDVLKIVGVGFAFYAIMFALGLLIPAILFVPKQDRGMYKFMTMFGNVGFMGFPVVASVFGSEYVFYASLFNIPFNILIYSLGIFYISGSDSMETFNWKKLINSPLIFTFISVLILLLHIPIPGVIARSVDYLNVMVVPAGMIIIGSSLANMEIGGSIKQWRVYVFSLLRLIFVPVAVWAVLRLFISDALLLGVATVLAATPVASSAVMLSVQYGSNRELSSWSVFVTTIMSVVTIPLVVYLLLI